MSCSINSRRGSILMEFVLVLPIYIAVLGMLFLIGDMGLAAIRISTGDRDCAMDAGGRSGHSTSPFLLLQMGEEALKTSSSDKTYRADESFQGSWSWQAAGRTSFAYKLQTYAGGLLSYPYLRYGDATYSGGILRMLVGGVPVLFHSKDYSFSDNVREYNYYTLKRTDLAHDPEAYRNWDSWDENGKQDTSKNHLVHSSGGKQNWYSKVYKEDFADSNPDNLESGSQDEDSLPSRPSGRTEYKRYETFVTWSQ